MPNVPLDTLPNSIKELVEIVGITAAMTIVEQRGGIRLYVPIKVSKDHWLTSIGQENFNALVKLYAGEEIEIPRCVEALTAVKHQMIKADADSGLTTTDIARKYNYTERGIRKAIRRAEQLEQSQKDQIQLEF